MKIKEKEFLKKNIVNLINENKLVKVNEILNYLDFINKVNYSEREILPLLNELILENFIFLENQFYKIKSA